MSNDNVDFTREEELAEPYLSSPMDSEELKEIERRRSESSVLSANDLSEIIGTYLLEVHFSPKRSVNHPYVGIIFTLAKSNRFGGGGHMPYYACADPACKGMIHPNNYSPTVGFVVCPECLRHWKCAHVSEQRIYCLTDQHWATAIARTFLRLGQDADILVKFFSAPLIEPTLKTVGNAKVGGDLINGARRCIRQVVYPLGNILSDLKHGASLEKRMYAFLKA